MGPEIVLPWLIEQGGVAATAGFWLAIAWVIGKTRPAKLFVKKMLVEPVVEFLLQELTRTNSGSFLMDHINAHFGDLRLRLKAGSANFDEYDKRLNELKEDLELGDKP